MKGKVPLATMDRSQLRPYLVSLLEKEHARDEMEKDRIVMVMLDLLKEKDDLYNLWLGLMDEQILGLYDFDAKEMRLVGVGSDLKPMDEVALSHEYVHALQDQSFGIGEKMRQLKDDSEKVGALQALTEGDATLAMTVYAQKHLTQQQIAGLSQQGGGTSQEKLKSAPPVLRHSLLFPYEQGALFAAALAQTGGWPAVDKAYGNLPTTTEQIMHPQKYTSAEGARTVELPRVAPVLGDGWTVHVEDTLGELGVYSYLANGIEDSRARKAAAGWGGDKLALFRNGNDYALVLQFAWDTSSEATEFMTALRDLRQARGGYKGTDPNHISWTDSGHTGYAATKGDRTVLAVTTTDSAMKKLILVLADY